MGHRDPEGLGGFEVDDQHTGLCSYGQRVRRAEQCHVEGASSAGQRSTTWEQPDHSLADHVCTWRKLTHARARRAAAYDPYLSLRAVAIIATKLRGPYM